MPVLKYLLILLFFSIHLFSSAQQPKTNHLQKSKTALYFESLELVNVTDMDATLLVRLTYAHPNNFMGKILYEDLKEAYLHPDAAKAIVVAQKALKRLYSSYSLIIYDASRPMSVQQKMWEAVKGTSENIYVSNPAHGGGLHNYGLAVDIGILDGSGNPLPMGTEVDYFGQEAHITNEVELVKSGKITSEARRNRLLLRQVMRAGGFHTLPSEWWHFNFCSRETARKKYALIK